MVFEYVQRGSVYQAIVQPKAFIDPTEWPRVVEIAMQVFRVYRIYHHIISVSVTH
jgi:hypothetical protein